MAEAISEACRRLADVCVEYEVRHACRQEPPGAIVLWQCRVRPEAVEQAVPVLQKAFAALACCSMSWGVGVKEGRLLVTLRGAASLGEPRRKLGLLPVFV